MVARHRFISLVVLLAVVGLPAATSAAATTTVRVSVSSSGAQANGASWGAIISGDGRFVAFNSVATNLGVSADTNRRMDVFEHDLVSGRTVRVSRATSGAQANGRSVVDAISTDGRFVLFASDATNLVPGDTNGRTDVFLRDVVAGTTTRVDVTRAGGQLFFGAGAGTMSPRGRYVEFARPTGAYVRDLHAGTTRLVSVTSNGTPFQSQLTCGNCPGFGPGPISDGGRFATFTGDPTESFPVEIWVRDLVAHTTRRVDVGSAQLADNSFPTAITPDGRLVVFTNDDLNTGDANLFVRDLQAHTTTLIGHWLEVAANTPSPFGPSGTIDDAGNLVAFVSGDTGIVAGDTNAVFDAFVHDIGGASDSRVSLSASGAQLGKASSGASISADGRFVVFATSAAAVAGDTNNASDIYMRGPLS